MMVEFERTQWASGQGFFHSGRVRTGSREVRYVFDCGSFSPKALTREIEEFARRSPGECDLLYLSHFHEDHVNGLPELFLVTHFKNVIIPLVPPVDRLYVLAAAVAAGSFISTWYEDLIADPPSAIRELDPEVNVIEVEPPLDDDGEGSNSAFPGEDRPVSQREEEDPEESGSSEDPELSVGRRSVLSGRGSRGGVVGWLPVWEWQTMTTKFAGSRREGFLDALAGHMGVSRAALDALMATPAGVQNIVRSHKDELVDAYDSLFADLNLSSLVLYSGPAVEMKLPGHTHRTRTRVERGEIHAWEIEPGWFGTGDQSMGPWRCKEVTTFFGSRLARVGSAALPHHGARGSFSSAFLGLFGTNVPVLSASVGLATRYEHPHLDVLLKVSSNGNHVVITTDSESSRWTESGVSYF